MNYDKDRFDASRALTNTDKQNDRANWVGANWMAPTYFTYNIGCKILVSKLVLRNSCNGDHKDR